MIANYFADPSLQMAIGSALTFYGLDPSPTAATRRPEPARTFAEQMQRIALGSEVLALVRQSVPVGEDDRRLIARLVDSACQRLEDGELHGPVNRQDVQPPPLTTNPHRRPNPSGPSAAPAKTNPTRTIRSSRWSAGRKGVRS